MSWRRSGEGSGLIMILAIAAIGIGVIGWVLPVAKNACDGVFRSQYGRCETSTVTLVVASGASAPPPTTVTFPTAFTNVPTKVELIPMFLPPSVTVPLTTTSYLSKGFQTSTMTWTSMPVASTEIYGDAVGNHRLRVDWTAATTFTFCVNIVTASTSATSYLTLEYSTAGSGGPFTELASAQRVPLTIGDLFCGANESLGQTFTAIPGAAQVNDLQLAIFGVNGGGAGDNPAFGEIYVKWTNVVSSTTTTFDTYGTETCGTSLTCSTTIATATSMLVKLQFAYAIAGGFNAKFTWIAESLTG